MDERFTPPLEAIPSGSAPSLRDKRRRFHELLAAQRRQIDSLEVSLEQQIARISDDLAAAHAAREVSQVAPQIDLAAFESQRLAIATEAENLAQLSSELDQRQADLADFEIRLKDQERAVVDQLGRQQAELDERTAELDAANAHLRQAQRTLALDEEELTADRQRAADVRQRLEEQLRHVDHQREELTTAKSETNNQRRRIAKELQHQRATQKAEIAKERQQLEREHEQLRAEHERRRAELQSLESNNQSELSSRLTNCQMELERFKNHNQQLTAQSAELSEALATKRQEHTRAIEDLALLGIEHQHLSKLLSEQTAGASTDSGELAQLRNEIAALHAKLAEAENRPASAATSEADTRKREDMQRRFELAVEDIRDLKRRNAELEERLATASESAAFGAPANDGKLDWEAQKRRMLASLEADDDDDEDRAEERLAIEGTIRITDEIVARKDREIHELKRVLEDQSSNLGHVAVGAAAIADLLDKDELVNQERENLKRLQTEWREKLRQAEIDISLERARMARERLEIDDKIQTLEENRARQGTTDADGKHDPTKSGDRSWWTRLGLKDQM